MFFGMSPIAGTIIGIILIAWLIGSGVKSAGKSFPKTDENVDEKYKEFMNNMGPMTWKERIVGAILIVLFVIIVIWISSKL